MLSLYETFLSYEEAKGDSMTETKPENTGTDLVHYDGLRTFNAQISREELSEILALEVKEEKRFIFGQPDKEFIL